MRKLLLAVCGIGLLGCQGGINARDDLQMALAHFNDGIRWAKIDQSATHLAVELRQHFAERYNGLEEECEVMDYEITQVDWNRKESRADVRVDFTWTMKRRGIVEKSSIEQHWEQKRGNWWLVHERLRKGSAMALLDGIPGPPPITPPGAPTAVATPR